METKIKQNLKKGIATFATLASEVKGQRLPLAKIGKMFSSFMPKEDFKKSERDDLISYLYTISNKNK
jgi:hypothetical protein